MGRTVGVLIIVILFAWGIPCQADYMAIDNGLTWFSHCYFAD